MYEKNQPISLALTYWILLSKSQVSARRFKILAAAMICDSMKNRETISEYIRNALLYSKIKVPLVSTSINRANSR